MEYIYTLLPAIMDGIKITLEVFFITLITSIPLGIILAACRLSKFKIIKGIAEIYILIMRGTPLLLQLIFIFFGLPIIGITFNRFTAAIIAFSLNYTAYFGEIFRGGIQSIDKGQYEAAEVLGLNSFQCFIKIILPQMIKNVLPSVANEVITLIKDTALVYVVGIGEVLRAGKIASNRDASLVPLFLVGILYLILTGVLSGTFKNIEKRYAYYE